MNILNHTHCSLCGSDCLNHYSICKDYYATGEEFSLLKCGTCGFIMTQNVPASDEIERYYETKDYISHSNTHKGVINRIYHLVRRWMLTRKAYLIRKATNQRRGKLLDIGTGTGYFADTMHTAGWDVTAIEKNDSARAFAKDNFGLDVLKPSSIAELQEATFDVITMWHVLEHIESLEEMGKQLNRLLKEQGLAILALPNCESADAEKYGEKWAAYDVPRHLWHFSPSTLEYFANKHGFRIKKIISMPYDSFYVAMLSEKNMQSRYYFVKGMWFGLLSWLKSCSDVKKSSSIIYLLQKE